MRSYDQMRALQQAKAQVCQLLCSIHTLPTQRTRFVDSLEISRTSAEQAPGRREVDGNDGILVPLQHALRLGRLGIPELHAAILASGRDPLAIRRARDGEHVVLSKRKESTQRAQRGGSKMGRTL